MGIPAVVTLAVLLVQMLSTSAQGQGIRFTVTTSIYMRYDTSAQREVMLQQLQVIFINVLTDNQLQPSNVKVNFVSEVLGVGKMSKAHGGFVLNKVTYTFTGLTQVAFTQADVLPQYEQIVRDAHISGVVVNLADESDTTDVQVDTVTEASSTDASGDLLLSANVWLSYSTFPQPDVERDRLLQVVLAIIKQNMVGGFQSDIRIVFVSVGETISGYTNVFFEIHGNNYQNQDLNALWQKMVSDYTRTPYKGILFVAPTTGSSSEVTTAPEVSISGELDIWLSFTTDAERDRLLQVILDRFRQQIVGGSQLILRIVFLRIGETVDGYTHVYFEIRSTTTFDQDFQAIWTKVVTSFTTTPIDGISVTAPDQSTTSTTTNQLNIQNPIILVFTTTAQRDSLLQLILARWKLVLASYPVTDLRISFVSSKPSKTVTGGFEVIYLITGVITGDTFDISVPTTDFITSITTKPITGVSLVPLGGGWTTDKVVAEAKSDVATTGSQLSLTLMLTFTQQSELDSLIDFIRQVFAYLLQTTVENISIQVTRDVIIDADRVPPVHQIDYTLTVTDVKVKITQDTEDKFNQLLMAITDSFYSFSTATSGKTIYLLEPIRGLHTDSSLKAFGGRTQSVMFYGSIIIKYTTRSDRHDILNQIRKIWEDATGRKGTVVDLNVAQDVKLADGSHQIVYSVTVLSDYSSWKITEIKRKFIDLLTKSRIRGVIRINEATVDTDSPSVDVAWKFEDSIVIEAATDAGISSALDNILLVWKSLIGKDARNFNIEIVSQKRLKGNRYLIVYVITYSAPSASQWDLSTLQPLFVQQISKIHGVGYIVFIATRENIDYVPTTTTTTQRPQWSYKPIVTVKPVTWKPVTTTTTTTAATTEEITEAPETTTTTTTVRPQWSWKPAVTFKPVTWKTVTWKPVTTTTTTTAATTEEITEAPETTTTTTTVRPQWSWKPAVTVKPVTWKPVTTTTTTTAAPIVTRPTWKWNPVTTTTTQQPVPVVPQISTEVTNCEVTVYKYVINDQVTFSTILTQSAIDGYMDLILQAWQKVLNIQSNSAGGLVQVQLVIYSNVDSRVPGVTQTRFYVVIMSPSDNLDVVDLVLQYNKYKPNLPLASALQVAQVPVSIVNFLFIKDAIQGSYASVDDIQTFITSLESLWREAFKTTRYSVFVRLYDDRLLSGSQHELRYFIIVTGANIKEDQFEIQKLFHDFLIRRSVAPTCPCTA